MLKLLKLLVLLISFVVLPVNAQQEPNDSSGDIRYVTDDLQTFMHSGPGRNYRILGSVMAGTRVTVLQIDSENEFIEIIDDKQRTGWIESQFISRQQSVRELVPNLRNQLDESNTNLLEQSQTNELLNQQLTDVNTRNERLAKDLASIQKENQRIQRELDTQDQSAQMEWFTRGGLIALVSIILGVIIAYLPKKRRRNDQWM